MKSVLISTPVRWDITEKDGQVIGTCLRLGLTATAINHTLFLEAAQRVMSEFFNDLYHKDQVHSFCFSHGLVYNIVEITHSVDVYPSTILVPNERMVK
jgi:hypothetical protein